MPPRARSAWFRTLGQLALILVGAAVLGLAVGQAGWVLAATALGVLAWHYWRLRRVLLGLTARRRWEPARGSGYVEERTVDVHIRRLRKTLEPTGLDGMVQTVRGSGYRFSAAL